MWRSEKRQRANRSDLATVEAIGDSGICGNSKLLHEQSNTDDEISKLVETSKLLIPTLPNIILPTITVSILV